MKISIQLCLILLNFLSLTAIAANEQKTPSSKDLKLVHQAIYVTKNQIIQTATEQKKIDASMTQTSQQLNQARKELEKIKLQQQLSIKQYQILQNNLDKTQTRIAETKTQIGRLLNAHYRNRQPNSVYLWLKKDSVDQKGRSLQYIRYLNAANEQVIQHLRQQQISLESQQKALTDQRHQLIALQQKQQQLVKKLHNQHSIQQNKFSVLDQQLTAQNKQLQTLKADERRLNNLLSRLSAQSTLRRINQNKSQTIAQNHTGQIKPQKLALASSDVQTTSNNNSNTANPTDNTAIDNKNYSLTSEDLALQATETIQPQTAIGLAQKQGHLPRPINGSITGKFGEQRPNGGTWKGLFFTTTTSSVRSIASGHVIYAAFLQGYGNTIILDHGEGYISIYTGLSSIGVSAGKTVSAGQNIGISGKLPDGPSGLYFEIRYHNQAMNPLSWIV
ncbi:MAG: peptidoglycan DD-metalloendopeptidase family protein [Snodgrassella sp.]|nr:peptidoglycan DD-metalloendopeptidase family protein [Snodgrassella sp.]